jgi:hypothetical protein
MADVGPFGRVVEENPPPPRLVAELRFETTQSSVAAYLVFCGHEVVESLWENETCTFFFDHTEDLTAAFALYNQGQASVEPIGYSTAYGQIMKLVKERRWEAKEADARKRDEAERREREAAERKRASLSDLHD